MGEFSMVDDCIVGEVRRLRQGQASKHGFDVKTIAAAAKSDSAGRGTVVSLVQKKTPVGTLKAD
ncbi:MAG: hypothetical protein ACLQOO_32660 [Terriglobia bacterium]